MCEAVANGNKKSPNTHAYAGEKLQNSNLPLFGSIPTFHIGLQDTILYPTIPTWKGVYIKFTI